MTSVPPPAIGVVAIGRNEGDRLVRCLDSIGPRIRTVYVDSGSTDSSVSAAQARGAHVIRLDMAIPFTAARARNAGLAALIEQAPETVFVQFVDGDCEVVPGWIDAARAFLEAHPGVAAVCGRRRERAPENSLYNRLCDLEWNTPVGEAAACGGDALFRIAALAQVDGFDARLIAGEEPELCARLRARAWKIWRLDAEMTLHDAAILHFRQWWLRAVRSGFGYYQVARATRDLPTPLYRRELSRTILWALAIPGAAMIAAVFVSPYALVAALGLYGLQIARIAIRRGGAHRLAWQYAFFIMVSKFAALQGVWRAARRLRRGAAQSAIFYK